MFPNQFRRLPFCLVLLLQVALLTITTACRGADSNENLPPIFDGRTLSGWTNRGQASFTVEDGVILGKTGKGGHGWLCTQKTYGDFILELEVNIKSGNSGVQIRSHIDDKDVMVGYQIEVDPSPRAWSGGLYEQGRRGWLQNLTNNQPARKAFKVGEWNKYRIVCIGDSIKSWVNGVAATDFKDTMDKDGIIALQVHTGKNCEVRFRNIRLQDLESARPGKNTGVNITQEPDKLRVEINGTLFTEYYFKDVPRPFFYPLIGPDDLQMTRNYPMIPDAPNEEHDHPHHRSLWYAHGAVNGHDFWTEQKDFGKIVHEKFTEIKSGKDSGVIKSEDQWVAHDGTVVCTDERVMRIYNPAHGRLFDFEITLHASNGEVTLGDTKEGTMAVRLAESMRLKQPKGKPGNGHIVTSTGVRDDETWGKRADWVDYYGPVEGRTVGIAIFDHPNNPRHPTWWHVRDYGLFAANPFGIHEFEKKEKDAGNFIIPAGQSVTFRYRFYVHEGDEQQANVVAHYADYVRSTSPKSK